MSPQFLTILFVLLHIISISDTEATLGLNPAAGVVEGFYWEQEDIVNGQWGQYSLTQRLQLISFLSINHLGVYWWSPQKMIPLVPWTPAEASGWAQTAIVGASSGVRIVYGLRPGWLSKNFSAPLNKIAEVQAAGIRSYSLNFDDAEGVASPEQQQREVDLAAAIKAKYPSMELAFIVPYCYYQSCPAGGKMSEWSKTMSIIDSIPQPSAAMVTTGPVITPDSMNPSKFPKLNSGRANMFWDNWNAADTNKRLPWGLGIRNIRAQSLFSAPYGYMMNLAFPLERIIHQVHCAGKLAAGSPCTSEEASTAWAEWLNEHRFLHGKTESSVQSALKLAIDQDKWYESIAEMEADLPALEGIFSKAPIPI